MTRKHKPMLQIGPLSIKSTYLRHAILKEHDFSDVRPSRVCNATMPAMTPQELQRVQPPAPVRAGSQDFLRYQSKGTL